MNKKLVYVTSYDFGKGNSSGVVKKILQQIETFSQNGFDVDYFYVNKKINSLYFVSKGKETLIGTAKWIKGIEYWKLIKKFLQTKAYDAAYVRHTGRIDPWILAVLKLLKSRSVKIVYEFPTFPYHKLAARMDLFVDGMFRFRLKKYVDRVVTYSKHTCIYGISTIQVCNGICVNSCNVVKKECIKEDMIELIAVAAFQEYHGYDRLLKAMGRYYKDNGKRRIILHLVGDGIVVEEYKRICESYHLEDKVIFYGNKYGEELDRIYDKADIAVAVLAAYKEDVFCSSALKVREYLAKGLPIITGCKEDIMENRREKFYLEFPNDDSEINVESIVKFYDDIYKNHNREEVHLQIREFAKQNADWNIVLQPIISYFKL